MGTPSVSTNMVSVKESDLNTIIVRTLKKQGGLAHKISDQSSSKKPFDYFAACNGFILYGESKLLKGYKSFNFSNIRHHQIEALKQAKESAISVDPRKILSVISVGVWSSRKFFDVFFIDIGVILNLMGEGKNSILKKELLCLKNGAHPPFKIVRGLVEDMENLPDRVIRSSSDILRK